MFRTLKTYVSLKKYLRAYALNCVVCWLLLRDRSLYFAQNIFYATFEQCDWVLSERNTGITVYRVS